MAIGINEVNSEASGTTIYNTLLYIGADGEIPAKVYNLPFGRLGGLLCWENYMPPARYAMSAWGAEIFVALTWDRGERAGVEGRLNSTARPSGS